jgi:PAS domain S-box-containing protein
VSGTKAKRRASGRAQDSLDLLFSISHELAAQLDLRQLLQRILQLTLESTGAPSGSILVIGERGGVTEGALAYEGQVHDHTADQLNDTYERGLAGWVVEHRQPALVESTLEDPRWLRRPGQEGDGDSRSAVCVPLITRDHVVGVLTLVHPEPGFFTDETLSILTIIADQAAIAVQNARLFAAEQERSRFASTLQEIARVINSALDPNLVFPQVLQQLERLVRYDSASIMVVDGDRLRLVAARGFEDSEGILGHTLPVDERLLTGNVLKTRQSMVVENVQGHPGWVLADGLAQSTQIRGWIGAPLIVREHAVGVLNVDSHRPAAYGRDEVDVVSAFADVAATAVANATLFAESQRQVRALAALSETARVVTASLNLDEVLERILNQTILTLNVEAASLAILDEATDELEFRVARGEQAGAVQGMRMARGRGITGWVVEHGELAVVAEVGSDARFDPQADARSGFRTRAMAVAPIRVQDRTIGALEAINPVHGEFVPEQAELLMGIAGLAGSAIAHAQLFEETQAARQLYSGLFEDSVDPILISDLQGGITGANQRAEAFLGTTRASLEGSPVEQLVLADGKRLAQDWNGLAAGEEISANGQVRHADGRMLPVEVHVRRVDIGRQPFLQWILRDVSERQALDELRTDLTSMIFHDLRSPLGNVISSLEVLHASLPADDEALQSVLGIALRSGRRLSRLVESLLDLGQLESGKAVLHKAPGAIGTIIVEAVEEILPVAEAKGHLLQFAFAPGDLPQINMDADMIRRVLINLLENAIKYTRSGGRITISARPQQAQVLISVADTGPGIPASEQQHIFDKFSRIQEEGRPKGLGLGLAFCRLAVEAHNGRIWVESQEGQGSTFHFTLPV